MLSFEGHQAMIQTDLIKTEDNGLIPIVLFARKTDDSKPDADYFELEIDGVSWFKADNVVHAMILYKILRENVTQHMHYITTPTDNYYFFDCLDGIIGDQYLTPTVLNVLINGKYEPMSEKEIIKHARNFEADLYRYNKDENGNYINEVCLYDTGF